MAHEPRHRDDTTTPPFSPLMIEQAEPGNDTAHLQLLLRERLARAPLPAPTLELRIRCQELAFSDAPNSELFPTRASEHEGLLRLVERLQARLGRERVLGIEPVADHRPERGTRLQPLDTPAAVARSLRQPGVAPAAVHLAAATPGSGARLDGAYTRPCWLLNPPQALRSRQSWPWLEGHPLQILAGPERIETGWWDGDPVARDYFIAQVPSGGLVWIYRARLPPEAADAPAGDAAERDADADDDQEADEADWPEQATPTGPKRGGGWFLHGRFG
jgi:protein ImuB